MCHISKKLPRSRKNHQRMLTMLREKTQIWYFRKQTKSFKNYIAASLTQLMIKTSNIRLLRPYGSLFLHVFRSQQIKFVGTNNDLLSAILHQNFIHVVFRFAKMIILSLNVSVQFIASLTILNVAHLHIELSV